MSLIPYERFVINTSLTLEGAASAVSESMARDKFTGSVSNDGFKIRRKIWYSNSSLPIIHGRFHSHERGVRVDIKMRLMLPSIAFLIFWSVSALFIIARSIMEWKQEGIFGAGLPFGLVMIPFMYFVVMLGWAFEVGAARRFIKTMFPRQHIV